MSAWLSLAWRGRLQPGETVLVLGATGTTGGLAVQLAKHLGAGRVVAAGRDPERLAALTALGADATISLTLPEDELVDAFTREAGDAGYGVVADYVWGRPTELLLQALTRSEAVASRQELRLVGIGEMAGRTIELPQMVLRSAPLTIVGNPGLQPPPEVAGPAFGRLMGLAAAGGVQIETEAVPLADVERAWAPEGRARRVLMP
jgi:NADPH:quinone reductase-like Zn-dependent oxidoreductase